MHLSFFFLNMACSFSVVCITFGFHMFGIIVGFMTYMNNVWQCHYKINLFM